MTELKRIVEQVSIHYSDYMTSDEKIKAVAIGGSVARKYYELGGKVDDIDVLFFGENIEYYKKKFTQIDDFKVELHYVPARFPYLLYGRISEINSAKVPLPKKESEALWGEKRCQKINESSAYHLLFSAWRELKKLIDGEVVFEINGWYTNLKSQLPIHPDCARIQNIATEVYNNQRGSAVSKLIDLMKLLMLCENNVFSKVYWTDLYLNNQLYEIKRFVEECFNPIPPRCELMEWLATIKDMYYSAKEQHCGISCPICSGDIERCNVGRCARDFISDSARGFQYNAPIGGLLSLSRADEYLGRIGYGNGLRHISTSYADYWDRCEKKVNNSIWNIYVKLQKRDYD